MPATILIYGCYGYTGELVARLASERRLDVILAGRNGDRTVKLAKELALPYRVFPLEAAADNLQGVGAVLNCAGPFAQTARLMLRACFAEKVHYLDITGEIEVFELAAKLAPTAEEAKVTVLPGAGFDVVPSDCLAAYVAAALPDATALTLAFASSGRMSHGTATTMLQHLGEGGAVRRGGAIVRVKAAHQSREFDFGRGPQTCVTIPWGDVSTAYHSTGIGDIDVFLALPAKARWAARASNLLGPVLRSPAVRRYLQRKLDAGSPGPSAARRSHSSAQLYAEARAPDGRVASARLYTPDGYDLTADASLRLAQRVAAGEAPTGFQTPSRAFGADFVLRCVGVRRDDVVLRG